MPFTISHAAVVMPFARTLSRWRALSAAVIGSMIPDFGFFLPWHISRVDTHSFDALFTFSLPVGMASYWLFEYIVKTATREVLPDGGYIRSAPFAEPDPIRSPTQWIVAAVAVLGGAVSHLILDGFTHEGARGVRMIPMLDDPVVDIAGHSLAAYKVLQQASSLAGLVIVGAIMWFSMRPVAGSAPLRDRLLSAGARHRWMATYILCAVLVAAISFVANGGNSLNLLTAKRAVDGLAVGGLRGLVCSLFVVSIVLQARLRATNRQRSLE